LAPKAISCKRIKRIKLVKALIAAESQIYESPALKTTLCKRRTRIELVIALIVAASHILPIFGFKSNLMQNKKEKQAAKSSNRCSIVTHVEREDERKIQNIEAKSQIF
jgi:hypothetical protein